jgi:hypothetical protein
MERNDGPGLDRKGVVPRAPTSPSGKIAPMNQHLCAMTESPSGLAVVVNAHLVRFVRPTADANVCSIHLSGCIMVVVGTTVHITAQLRSARTSWLTDH